MVITASQPLSTMPSDSKFANVPSPSLINNMEMQRANQIPQAQSGRSLASTQSSTELHTPVSRIPASDSAQSRVVPVAEDHDSNVHRPITVISSPSPAWPSTMEPTPKAKKRQSHMSSKPQYTSAYLTKLSNEGLSAPPGQPGFQEKERERKAKSGRFWSNFGRTPERNSKPVFGVPLSDSIQIASVAGLPAPVFRCIEYLESKKAEEEEGIYRLSGSSAVIKGLKDRFDVEGDVKLLKVDEHWDPHAIAGLMKTYLRDLPTSLLTRELHPRFLAVMGESIPGRADFRFHRSLGQSQRAISIGIGSSPAELHFAAGAHSSSNPDCQALAHQQDDFAEHRNRVFTYSRHTCRYIFRAGLEFHENL